jgi:hypothetical protein
LKTNFSSGQEAVSIILLIVQIFAGIGSGVIAGLVGYLFKFITHKRLNIYLKALYCVFCCCCFDAAADISTWTNARFIASLVFGYTCYQVWGEDGRPNDELYFIFFLV